MYGYTCAYAYVVIKSTWHLTRGLVNESCRYLTVLCFHENCLSVVIISCVWDVTILLCFCRAIGGSTQSHWQFLALMELPRQLNIICVNMGIRTFGCAVRFNHWYKNFTSGLHSCENQPPCSWLIVELLLLFWVKNCKWSH